jgi:iron-sulfur cluster repair protein YtfE (RIC family)
MMESITSTMQEDHVLIDGFAERASVAAQARDWSSLRREGREFLRRLRRHIEMEENVLFPAFEQRTGMRREGPIQQMRIEHERMQPILAGMQAALAVNDVTGFELTLKSLLDLLQPHNVKEERMMYPMLDDAMGAEAGALIAGVKAMAV